MGEIVDLDEVRAVLARSRVVAVLGAHVERHRPAFYVPEYLHGEGYRVLPVNPNLVGQTLWGEPVRGSLRDLTEPVDIVDVFRRAELLPQHLDEILAMRPPPKVVWLQLGIRNDAFARALVDAGLEVVQSRCTLADHRRFGRPAPGSLAE